MSELMRETLRVYENEELRRAEAARRFGEAVRLAQKQSAINGTDKMTMDEIDEEIAAARRERDSMAKNAW